MLNLGKERSIEGRIEVDVEIGGDTIGNVSVRGDLARDLGKFLRGKSPMDAHSLIGHVFNVCPGSHQHAFALAVEQASGNKPSTQKVTKRNILEGLQFLQAHLFWFYCTALTDYIDLERTLELVSRKPVLRENLRKIESLLAAGGRGEQARAFTGHPLYTIPPELSIDLVMHSMEALSHIARLMAWGKTIGEIAGRVPSIPEKVRSMKEVKEWIDWVFVADARELFRRKWSGSARGKGYYLSHGVFEEQSGLPEERLFPMAISSLFDNELDSPSPKKSDVGYISPGEGRQLSEDLLRRPWEVGPLARLVTSFQRGRNEIAGRIGRIIPVREGDEMLNIFSCPEGRVLARAIECSVLAEKILNWVRGFPGERSDNDETAMAMNGTDDLNGKGLWESPRGALEHRVQIRGTYIYDCQAVIPTSWNFRPDDALNIESPIKAALTGNMVADPERPLEVIRVVRSFDPCVPCIVRVIHPASNKILEFNIA